MAKVHPGFKAVQSKIAAKGHMPMADAGAVLASAAMHASPKARAANPRLARVKGFGAVQKRRK